MYKKLFLSIVSICVLITTSCGDSGTLSLQEAQRDVILPELVGIWTSLCEKNRLVQLTFDEVRLVVDWTDYYDPECTDPKRTTQHAGSFDLAHTFKEGKLNSIVFTADSALTLKLHTDFDVTTQNNAIANVQNEEEQKILPTMTPEQIAIATRENMRIRETKKLEYWKRDEPKTLSRLQIEKLNEYGLKAFGVIDYGSRVGFRYELDNGLLQIALGGSGVFAKQIVAEE